MTDDDLATEVRRITRHVVLEVEYANDADGAIPFEDWLVLKLTSVQLDNERLQAENERLRRSLGWNEDDGEVRGLD